MTRPKMGTWVEGRASPWMRMDRFSPAPREMYPSRSKVRRWACTVEVDFNPVAAQISRTVGGTPGGGLLPEEIIHLLLAFCQMLHIRAPLSHDL